MKSNMNAISQRRFLHLVLVVLLGLVQPSDAFSQMTMMAKRGSRSLQQEFGGGNNNVGKKKKSRNLSSSGSGLASGGGAGAGAGGAPPSAPSRWQPVQGLSSVSDLKLTKDQVQLVDTMVPALKDQATNPNGAVAVVQHDSSVYCTSVSCPSCRIPLNKAQVLGPAADGETGEDPRLACDFCKATFNLRTGERVTSVGGGGIVGGLVKGLFSAQDEKKPLKVYALGEKDGKVLINIG